jgi:hypothetical protein
MYCPPKNSARIPPQTKSIFLLKNLSVLPHTVVLQPCACVPHKLTLLRAKSEISPKTKVEENGMLRMQYHCVSQITKYFILITHKICKCLRPQLGNFSAEKLSLCFPQAKNLPQGRFS